MGMKISYKPRYRQKIGFTWNISDLFAMGFDGGVSRGYYVALFIVF